MVLEMVLCRLVDCCETVRSRTRSVHLRALNEKVIEVHIIFSMKEFTIESLSYFHWPPPIDVGSRVCKEKSDMYEPW